MPAKTILTISLAQELRQRVDAEAERQRRSRSFVVAEALQAYLEQRDSHAFSDARARTLREGLALSPSERLELSEALWRDLARGREFTSPWTAGFDTYEDYERWRRAGGPRAG